MNMFGFVKYNDFITINSNFRTFKSSMLLLIRCMTGESWNEIMLGLTLTQNCNDDQTLEEVMKSAEGCGYYMAFPFFISFMVLACIIVINLFVAVVVDTFILISEKDILIFEDDFSDFFILWGKYDKNCDLMIESQEFILLMKELKSQMGYYHPDNSNSKSKAYSIMNIYLSYNDSFVTDNRDVIHLLNEINIIGRKGKIHILDAIITIINRVVTDKFEIDDSNIKINNYKVNNAIKEKLYEY